MLGALKGVGSMGILGCRLFWSLFIEGLGQAYVPKASPKMAHTGTWLYMHDVVERIGS